jgi:hypothetical protein
MHNFVAPDVVLREKIAMTLLNNLGTAPNEAVITIERANQTKFDGILTNKIDFNKSDELPRGKLINHFRGQTRVTSNGGTREYHPNRLMSSSRTCAGGGQHT